MKNPNNTFNHKEQIFFLHKWMCYVLLVVCAITTCTSYLDIALISKEMNYLPSMFIINNYLQFNEALASSYTIIFTYLTVVIICYFFKFKKTSITLIGDSGEKLKTVLYRVITITLTSAFLGLFIFLAYGIVSRSDSNDPLFSYVFKNFLLTFSVSIFCIINIMILNKYPKEIAKKYKIQQNFRKFDKWIKNLLPFFSMSVRFIE